MPKILRVSAFLPKVVNNVLRQECRSSYDKKRDTLKGCPFVSVSVSVCYFFSFTTLGSSRP